MPFSKTCTNICSRLCYTVVILAFVGFTGFMFHDLFVPLGVFSPKDAQLVQVDIVPENAQYLDLIGGWSNICYSKNYMATFTAGDHSCIAPAPIQPEYDFVY